VVIVSESHEILSSLELPPPHVLVGHSLGGLYVSLCARTYPGKVAPRMLLDSVHPEQVERCQQHLPVKKRDPEQHPWWVKTLLKTAPPVIKAEMGGR
jgi:pimeloyl-ACP methyl ester carboxylesterase